MQIDFDVSNVSIEKLGGNDALNLQTLAKSVGWNFSVNQANLFLSAGGAVYGYRHQGQLIACAGIYTYETKLASLGIVMVHSEYQRKGFGKRIISQCLAEAQRADIPVILVATTQGFPLYQSFGFQTIGYIHRFESELVSPLSTGDAKYNVSNFRKSDLPQIMKFDELAYGTYRHGVYEALIKFVQANAVARDKQGNVRGFALSRAQGNLLVIGPVIAQEKETAAELVENLCVDWKKRVRIDVPNEQTSFMAWLKEKGFQQKVVSPVMVLRGADLPDRCRYLLFGIADPVFG